MMEASQRDLSSTRKPMRVLRAPETTNTPPTPSPENRLRCMALGRIRVGIPRSPPRADARGTQTGVSLRFRGGRRRRANAILADDLGERRAGASPPPRPPRCPSTAQRDGGFEADEGVTVEKADVLSVRDHRSLVCKSIPVLRWLPTLECPAKRPPAVLWLWMSARALGRGTHARVPLYAPGQYCEFLVARVDIRQLRPRDR